MSESRISVAVPSLDGNEKKYLNECIDENWISSAGKFIGRFEADFGRYVATSHAMTCANGTAALHLALAAVGVKEGDEVIMPTFTYVATANAVRYCGAKPVFVDCEEGTWNIDPSQIEKRITSRTKAIIPVHLYGHPSDMDPVMAIAKPHGIAVIEDAAQALGAFYRKRPAGGLGTISTFSFFGNKTVTTGEGGMVCTADPELAQRVKILRNQGMDPNRRYWFPEVGYNYRMTNLQAAIGLAQLERVESLLQRRAQVAARYREALRGTEDRFELPKVEDWAKHSYWMFSVVLSPKLKVSRDRVMEKMMERGIETRPFFYPMHVLPMYAESSEPYPIATSVAARGINLPTHAHLKDRDVDRVVSELKKVCEG